MSILIDDSTDIPSSLKKRVRKVQYEPEPTVEEFYNPVPINLRRPQRVQEAQVPVGQILDEFTIKGERDKLLKEKEEAEEKTKTDKEKKAKEDELGKNTWVAHLKNMFPNLTASQTATMFGTIATGNTGQFLNLLNRFHHMEQVKNEKKKKQREAEKKAKDNKKKKHEKRYRIDAKGNRVLIKKEDE